MRGRLPATALLVLWGAGLLAGEPDAGSGIDSLKVYPAGDGSVTFWLSTSASDKLVKDIQVNPGIARHGAPFGDQDHWQYRASDSGYVNLGERTKGKRVGHVWGQTAMESRTGGRRLLRVSSYGDVKIFLDESEILNKPAALGYEADIQSARVELPQGSSRISVAVGVRWGYCGFRLQILDEKGGLPVSGDIFRIDFPKGGAPSPGVLMTEALAFLPEKLFLEPGETTMLGLGLRAGWPGGVGSIQPRFLDSAGKELPGAFESRAPDQVLKEPWKVTYTYPRPAPDKVEIRCELVEGGKVLGHKALTLYSFSGIETETAKLWPVLAATQKTVGFSMPHSALALEKLDIWLDLLTPRAKKLPWPEHRRDRERLSAETGLNLVDLLASARSFQKVEAEGKDPFRGKTGYFERAYRSVIDESVQPYFCLVPREAKADILDPKPVKKYPLIVFLHGYVDDYHKHRWWVADAGLNAACDRNGVFLCVPFARSNADFLGAGEEDVRAVLAEMKRHYPIDEDRVYLYGYSMGGMGVYSLGGHYPDLWAAGVVLAGRADSPLLMGTAGLKTLQAFKQYLIRVDQPIDLCENFKNIPLRIYHGVDDQIIYPEEALRMEKRLKEIGCDARLTLHKGDHWGGFDILSDEAPVKWLLSNKRDVQVSARWIKNYSPRFGRMGGVTIGHVTGGVQPFDVAWENKNGVLDFTRIMGSVGKIAFPQNTLAKVQLPLLAKEWVAGLQREEGAPPTHINHENWVEDLKGADFNPNWKSPLRCGPVKEATYGPFVVVYGTTGSEATTLRLKSQATGFADDWYLFGKGVVAVKADREVTDEEKKTKSLILFGEEQENAIHALAAASKQLPFSVKDGSVQVGEKSVPLKGRGILYIHPNPLEGAAASSSLVISAGIRYGQHLPINHKLDLVPDFLLYEAAADNDGTRTNRPLLAGFFDGKWKLDPKTTWWFME